MSNQNFHVPVDGAVNGQANDGRGKLALVPETCTNPPLLRVARRSSPRGQSDEQALLNHVVDVVAAAHPGCARTLIVDYYVSLKSNPFVILTGAEGHGKTEFIGRFVDAMIGRTTSQYALIPGAAWHNGTGKDNYYQSMHERFSSWRFLELLQEAADPCNVGKLYLACFDALHPDELEYYFATLLRVGPGGEKRLNLPGFPANDQPLVPDNVCITATVDLDEWGGVLSPNVLRHAGVIEFCAPSLAPDSGASAPAPPPVGFQRLWLRSAVRQVEQARERLARLLGPAVGKLSCSPGLRQLLWRSGVPLYGHALHELTTYVANSFDADGCGLFDPHDRLRNAQIAFDAQVVQRVRWRLRATEDPDLWRDLAGYLQHAVDADVQQAVA